ncbi:unnamed protein product [Schistosoma curassoni]|uniref:Transmembrane protein n=1 Tax=Schistosoma curassoni TaxID=6186 RepID=A0A183L1T9_9TREM|nr:unnamed protein product [Schistosoma curassoni]
MVIFLDSATSYKLSEEKIVNKISHNSNMKIEISGNNIDNNDNNNNNMVDPASNPSNSIQRSCDQVTEKHSLHKSPDNCNDHINSDDDRNTQSTVVTQPMCDHSTSFEGQIYLTDTMVCLFIYFSVFIIIHICIIIYVILSVFTIGPRVGT